MCKFYLTKLNPGSMPLKRLPFLGLFLILFVCGLTTTASAEALQAVTVSGVVTDDSGNTIPGVNIYIKGTTRGTTTDLDGRYSLQVDDTRSVLVFSFIGYENSEVLVGSQSVINVTLATDIKTLSEVIVVGYGTQKKTTVTGAIASVNAKELGTLPTTSIDQALQGRAPGVQITNNGSPGQAATVRIRGVGTINNANPLYVVDGVMVGDNSNVDPKDIQSIEVLKDAYAAAIYGSRAANGVILITTKGGTSEKLTVNFDSYVGVQTAWKQLDLLNRDQYLAYAERLLGAAGLPDRIKNGLDDPIYPGATQTFRQTDTDWQDAMFRNAPIQQHRFEVARSGDVSKFFISGGYFDQEGIMIGTNFKRGNVRINSDHKVSKRVTFGQNLYVALDNRRNEQNAGSIGTNIRHMIYAVPYLPVYNPTAKGGFFGHQLVDGSDPLAIVRSATNNRNTNTGDQIVASGYLNIKLTDWLSYRVQASLNYMNYVNRNFTPAYDGGAGAYHSQPYASISQQRGGHFSPTLINQLTAEKSIKNHNINFTLIGEKQNYKGSFVSGGGNNPITNLIQMPRGVQAPSVNADVQEFSQISYAARLNYDYNGKYLLGASYRYDGSSKFAPGYQWGTFPSVSAGWRISEEDFIKNLSTPISELKIRASYGLAGNNQIGNYDYQATLMSNTYYEFDKGSSQLTQGYTVNKMANRMLQWESVKMLNIGIDGGLFNNKVNFGIELFENTTDDMILAQPLPPSLGYDQSPMANKGSMRNRGLEWQLNYSHQESEFKWNAGVNMSFIRNTVLSLGRKDNTIASQDWYGDNITMTKAGKPIGYFYGYVVDGIFQNQAEIDAANALGDNTVAYQPNAAPGDIRFKDLNGDGVITADDKRMIGSALPNFTFGVNFSANYKNFDATLFLQGVQGNEIYSITKYYLEAKDRLFNAGTAILDAWTHEGQKTDVPRLVLGDPNRNSRASTRFVEDGSYIRVKNVTIGYTIPTDKLKALTNDNLSKLRVYFSGTNLLTFTKYKDGYDPEIGSFNGNGPGGMFQSGIDYGQYPQPRQLTFGVQLGL